MVDLSLDRLESSRKMSFDLFGVAGVDEHIFELRDLCVRELLPNS